MQALAQAAAACVLVAVLLSKLLPLLVRCIQARRKWIASPIPGPPLPMNFVMGEHTVTQPIASMLCWHVHHTCRCSCTISAVSRLDMTWHFMCQCWSYCGSAYCHRDAKRWWPCAARPMHKIHALRHTFGASGTEKHINPKTGEAASASWQPGEPGDLSE